MARRTLGGTTLALITLTAAVAGAAPTTAPTTAPAAGLLGQVDAAYAALSAGRFAGTIAAHFDVAGKVTDHTATFASAFAAPNRFRHEVTGDTLVCSTGSHVYATLTAANEYVTGDAPAARAAAGDWPAGVGKLLSDQNPSLLLAIVPSAKTQLGDKATEGPAVDIGGVRCPTLTQSADGQTVTLAFDPATHLLRRATFDLAAAMTKAGTADVRAATVTVDYTTAEPAAAVSADQFAYAPPAAAVLASAGPVGQGDGSDEDPAGAAKALVGHPAPPFTLDDLDGKKVSLADLKGKVVVLDMWATWCGPCVASLPHLDELAKGYREKGAAVAVYAVNQQEDAAKVKPFVAKKKWTLPVLLDSDGAMGKAYKADAIPETVIVGKDGTVKKVFVGSGNEKGIADAVEAELGQK